MQIKISVVIPAKNRAHTLPKCLESILDQSYPAAEIIVVDDASTDNTQQVVERYADRGVIYAALPKGKGAQAARNHGVQIATSEWIAFQDSDDIWLPKKLALQVVALSSCKFDKSTVVHGDGLKRNDATGVDEPLRVRFTAGDCYAQLLLQPAPMFPTLLASKQAILNAGGLDENCPSYQEWDTAIRLSRNNVFMHIQEPLFVWIWHAGETISKDYQRDLLGFDYVISAHKSEILAVHGGRGWRRMKTGNVSRVLRVKLWGLAEAMLKREKKFDICFALARVFSRLRFFPFGAGRLLKLLSIF